MQKLMMGSVIALVCCLARAQSTNEFAATTAALQLEANRGTNADGFCFLSTQHPEWPPMPTSPDPKLELVRVGVGTYLVDDRDWKYPTPPPAATNVAAVKAVANQMGATLNTNYIASRPQLRDMFKRGIALDAFPTNTADKVQNALNARRTRAICDAIDHIINQAASATNTIAK